MDSRIKTHLFVFVSFLMTFAVLCFAETQAQTSQAENDLNVSPEFPFYAQITAGDVYIRSGPGTQHYFTGKLNKGDTVKVLGQKFTWSLILPPKGSFSWISKQYVAIDSSNPDIGIVTGDEVRVYAGSEFVAPIHSDRVQVKMNKGNKVHLLGEEIGDYYKITPPDGAYLWVSTEYTSPLAEPVRVQPAPAQTKPAETPVSEPQPRVVKPPAAAPESVVVRNIEGPESEQLKLFYALQDVVEAERKKPLNEQDYSRVKKNLEQIAGNSKSPKASRYAKFLIEQIKCYELAAAVEKADSRQNDQLNSLYQKIEDAHETKMTQMQDLGRFSVVGTLKKSSVYGPQPDMLRYIITNPAGKIICYAVPVGSAASIDLSQMFGKDVGLVGKIEPHPQTASALVKFTDIEVIKTEE